MAKTLEERLREKYVVDESTGCWNWTASLRAGYGQIRAGGSIRGAHRVMYELVKGEIPEGLVLDHLCRNRRCVNPDHMEPVTQRTNLLRGETIITAPYFRRRIMYWCWRA